MVYGKLAIAASLIVLFQDFDKKIRNPKLPIFMKVVPDTCVFNYLCFQLILEVRVFLSFSLSLLQLKEQVFLANFGDIDATAEFDGLVNDFDKL
jgi:hypothetical protein